MAKASVEMVCPTCGNEFTWSTTCYNRREADKWEEWADGQERECPECYAETMRKKREAEAQEAMEKAKNNLFGIDIDALDLKGSEKQNDWAKKILAKFIADLEKMKPTEKGVKKISEILRSANARELIDNRDCMMIWLEERIRNAQDKAKTATEETKQETNEEVKPQPKAEAPKTEWKKFAFNIQNIVRETDNGILIQMPHNSEHDGFKFWTSKKLVRDGRHSYEYLLSVNADMKFNLKKNGNGKYNRFKVIAEKEITADELAEAFGGYCEVQDAPKVDEEREVIIHHTPDPLTPIENAEALPELTR